MTGFPGGGAVREVPLDMAAAQAREHLEQVVLPFWLANGIDHAHGGFHTCFDNRGRIRVSDDKFTWSQGRFVWTLAHASSLVRTGLLQPVDGVGADELAACAVRGAQFLADHALRSDGTCAFALVRDGSAEAAGQPARSVYADLFVAMGFAEVARQSGQTRWLGPARRIIDRAHDDIHQRVAPTPPYAIPSGHNAFGPHLILLNALVVMTRAERDVAVVTSREEALAAELDAVMSFHDGAHGFREMPPLDASQHGGDSGPPGSNLIASHRVPGHALEAMWIALEAMELLGDATHRERALASIAPLCELGWDGEHGGLFRYVDEAGGAPRGMAGESEYEQLVRRTWDMKLWWVHTEAAAVTATAAHRYGRAECAEWFERIWRYTLGTFPGRSAGEEWVQIRNRDGSPRDEVVALPVKDPFHITRNLMQIVELNLT
ncbi:AGE family epimerase/isomerase [Ruania halotolerans]|uniref:AGE family epimerase/isomerase n=1 Tax=Ruania halotolerans TaxID=2897773 RepID=UPI001E588986|nr:AGE family epimerase/isomerase [Ruania halotolerans]UFU06905.1 AGE family epimerase/isomerase [Ruania halotolerans]